MKMERKGIVICVITLLGLSNGNLANAAPLNLITTVDTLGWTVNTNSIDSNSSTIPGSVESTTNPTFTTEITPAQPGVTGSVKTYSHTTTTTTNYTDDSQWASFDYSAALNDSSSDPLTYTISGIFNPTDTLINNGTGSLQFNMAMDVSYSASPTDTFGSLSFKAGYMNGPTWGNSYSDFFDLTENSIAHGSTLELDFDILNYPVFFEAIYTISDFTNDDLYTVNNLSLNVNANLSEQIINSIVTTNNDVLISEYELPALPVVVPVPAAVWLFVSGLIGIAGIARRKPA